MLTSSLLLEKEKEVEKKAPQPLYHAPAMFTEPELQSPPMTLTDSERRKMKNKKNKERKKKKKKNKEAASGAGSSSHSPEQDSLMKLLDSERKKIKNKKNKERKKKKKAAAEALPHLPEQESPVRISESERKKIKNKKNKERKKKKKKKKKKAAVATHAAMDQTPNYDEVFARKFVPTGLTYLIKKPAEQETLKNFHLQGQEEKVDASTLREGVSSDSPVADFGTIGRVAAVDSGVLPRAYTKRTGDHILQEHSEVQKGMRSIPKLCLSNDFDTFPTLLCADGCSMIDKTMGIYALTSAVGSGTQLTGPLPSAASPAFEKGGASKPAGGNRKSEDFDGGDGVNRPRDLKELLKNVKRVVPKDPENPYGSVAVFWKHLNGYYHLLGRIGGVPHMNRDELEGAIRQILTQHHCPTGRNMVYYSNWTNMRMTQVYIEGMEWVWFRIQVKGVHVHAKQGDEQVGAGAEEGGVQVEEEGDDEGDDEEVEADKRVGEEVIVWWRHVGGFNLRLGEIQGVPQMRTKRQFKNAVNQVLIQRHRPINRDKTFYSIRNSRMAIWLSLRNLPLAQFRVEVAGVQVHEVEGDIPVGAEEGEEEEEEEEEEDEEEVGDNFDSIG